MQIAVASDRAAKIEAIEAKRGAESSQSPAHAG